MGVVAGFWAVVLLMQRPHMKKFDTHWKITLIQILQEVSNICKTRNHFNGYVLSPLPVAPVNQTDMVLFPEGLKALKKVAKEVGLDLRGAYVNLDGGFDSAHNRKCIFNAGLIPNIKENHRNRKTPKRGRKRFFNEAIHALRMRVERTFAWEDKFKRLLLRFERIQQRHYGMKLMAYTLINLRAFCGT